MSRSGSIAVVILLAGACDARVEEESVACDPFMVVERTTELQPPIAVGRAMDATFYAVDGDGPIPRVFVSAADGLRRVAVDGSGGGGESTILTITDHDPQFTLEVIGAAGELRMELLSGVLQEAPIDGAGEELQIVGPDEIAGLQLFDLPLTYFAERFATSEHGHTVALLRPEHLEGYEDYRLFLGDDDLIEHEITAFAREEDGGTTTITFDIDGTDGTAYFPSDWVMDRSPTLTIDGVISELTLLEESAAEGVEFRCLVRPRG